MWLKGCCKLEILAHCLKFPSFFWIFVGPCLILMMLSLLFVLFLGDTLLCQTLWLSQQGFLSNFCWMFWAFNLMLFCWLISYLSLFFCLSIYLMFAIYSFTFGLLIQNQKYDHALNLAKHRFTLRVMLTLCTLEEKNFFSRLRDFPFLVICYFFL